MPNKGMFPKDRPGGLAFRCCDACNQGSKWFDDIASLVGSIRFSETDTAGDHFARKLQHLAKEPPDIFAEMQPSFRQNKQARKYIPDNDYGSAGAFNVGGPLVSQAMLLYGAKLALALHWQETK